MLFASSEKLMRFDAALLHGIISRRTLWAQSVTYPRGRLRNELCDVDPRLSTLRVLPRLPAAHTNVDQPEGIPVIRFVRSIHRQRVASFLVQSAKVAVRFCNFTYVAKHRSPDDMGIVDVSWEGRTLTMFTQDIGERCVEIVQRAAHP